MDIQKDIQKDAEATQAPIVKDEPALEATPISEPVLKEADPAAPIPETATSVPETKEAEAKAEASGITVPETEAKKEEEKPVVPPKVEEEKPVLPPKDESSALPEPAPTALVMLSCELPNIYKEAEYQEMWGVELSESPETHVPTSIVLTKFLRANVNDVAKAKKQLIDALKWRKQMEPLKLLKDTEFNKSKFGNLGFVTTYDGKQGKEIVTWNIYGAVKDKSKTFGDVEEFLRWRTALMELSVSELSLQTATTPIPESGPDPYRMIQVHDYLNVSFLRVDPAVKNASKQTITVMSMAYPELLKEKFFVNVPVLMSWMFAAMKIFLSAETVKKFHPLGYGQKLAGELPDFGEQLPKVYGGNGKDVTEGLAVRYGEGEAAVEKEQIAKE